MPSFSMIGTLIQVGRIKQIYLHGLLVAHSMGSLDDYTSRLGCSPDMQALKYRNYLSPSDIFTWWVSKHCKCKNWKTNTLGNKKVKATKAPNMFFDSLQVNIWLDNGLGLSQNKPSSGSLLISLYYWYHISPYGIMGGNELMDRLLVHVWLKFYTSGNSYLELTIKQLDHFSSNCGLLFTNVHNKCNIST